MLVEDSILEAGIQGSANVLVGELEVEVLLDCNHRAGIDLHELQGDLENGSVSNVVFWVCAFRKFFELSKHAIHNGMVVEIGEVLEKTEHKLGKRTEIFVLLEQLTDYLTQQKFLRRVVELIEIKHDLDDFLIALKLNQFG